MKKIIRSIIAFFFRKKDKQTTNADHYNLKAQQEAYRALPAGTHFCVYHDATWMSYEDNLFAVSKKYPVLKKSTLYNAFKGDEPRTYHRDDYTVVKTIKA